MDDLVKGSSKSTFKWKRFLIILAAGIVPTVICFFINWWWIATLFLLLTVLGMVFSFPAKAYPLLLTGYAVFAIAWTFGSWLDGQLSIEQQARPLGRLGTPFAAGAGLGIVLVVLFWLITLYISTKWILAVSDSFDISGWDAFKLVFSQTFDTAQNYIIVENGEVASEKPKGMLSDLGGPGVLVVRPGNAVVLERGGKTTRIVGAGQHQLKRFENIKRPHKGKGILELGPQFAVGTADNVLTQDGIPLTIEVGVPYQIESQNETDQRPESHVAGGEATTPVIGDAYPVYEATLRKVVFKTSAGGWHGLFPAGPVNALRDIIATYTLDEIFELQGTEGSTPDRRTIRRIEEQVSERFNARWAGISFRGLDIRKIEMPPEIRERLHQKWTSSVERQLKIAEAKAEGQAIVTLSQARTEVLRVREKAKYVALKNLTENVQDLLDALSTATSSNIAINFVSVIQELTRRIGQDESVAMRYIDAMQAVIQSEGNKSFVITPPNPPPGFQPSVPQPSKPRELGSGKEEEGGD